MFFALLCVAFLGQEPTEAKKDSHDPEVVQAVFKACEDGSNAEKAYRIKAVNAKIEFIAAVRKMKVNPQGEYSTKWVFHRDGTLYVNVQLQNQKQRTEYIKQLQKEVMQEKLDILNHRLEPKHFPMIWAGSLPPIGVPNDNGMEVRMVQGPRSMVVKFVPVNQSDYIHVTGIDTEGLVDDSMVKTNIPLIRNGTFNWGGSTLRSYRAMTNAEMEEFAKLVKAIEVGEKVRPWESADRQHTTRAKLVGFDLKKVTLQREDGETVELELGKLSTEDQAYVKRALGLDPL